MTPLEEEEIAGAINDLHEVEGHSHIHGGTYRMVVGARKRLERLVEPQDTRETVQGHE